MERDFRNQRMIAIYLTAIGTVWLMLLWMDGMVSSVDMQSCYYSSSRDEYFVGKPIIEIHFGWQV